MTMSETVSGTRSRIQVGACGFVLGIGAVLLGQKLAPRFGMQAPRLKAAGSLLAQIDSPARSVRSAAAPRPNPPPAQQSVASDPFQAAFGGAFQNAFASSFKQMQALQEQMMKQLDPQALGFNGLQGPSGVRVSRHEDQRFVYYDIRVKDLNQEKLNVKVADGQIEISGQLDRRTRGSGSFYSSSFERSFPVPPDVDADKVQMQRSSDRLTLKFPKVALNS